MNGIAEQTSNYMKEVLMTFCYEFYEHLEGYEEMTIADCVTEIINGLNNFHDSINRDEIYERISETNDDLAQPEYDDEGYEVE